jgi:hypothetical protein
MSAIDDYLQLVAKGSPLNNQWQQLKSNISKNIPSMQDMQDSGKMAGLALQAPMMGVIGKSTGALTQNELELFKKDIANNSLSNIKDILKSKGLPTAYSDRQNISSISDIRQGLNSGELHSGIPIDSPIATLLKSHPNIGESSVLLDNLVEPNFTLPYKFGFKGDKNILDRSEYSKTLPNVPNESKVAHFLRGLHPTRYVNSDNGVKDFSTDPSLFDSIANAPKGRFNLKKSYVDSSIGQDVADDLLRQSTTQFSKAAYVTRQETTAPSGLDHLVSTRLVHPTKDAGDISRKYFGYVSSLPDANRVYKIEPGQDIVHTLNLADKNEVLMTNDALSKSKSMNYIDFLLHTLKHGTPPFAIGGLGLSSMQNYKDDRQ